MKIFYYIFIVYKIFPKMRKKTCSVPLSISNELDRLTREMAEFGVAYIGHGVINLEGDHSGYFSNAQWKEIYMDKIFFHKEPILDAFVKDPQEPVHWKCVEENQVAVMRREIVGILGGVTLCNFRESFFGFLNIGFADERDTHQFLKNNSPLLKAYHETFDRIHLAWRLLASGKNENLLLPETVDFLH